MVVRDDISDDGLLIGMVYADICKKKTSQAVIVCLTARCRSCETRMDFTFWVQKFGETQVLLGQVEGVLQVVVSVGLLQFVEINQVWPGKIKSIESSGY